MFYGVEYLLGTGFKGKKIENDLVYNDVKELTETDYPSSETKFEKILGCFYFLVRMGWGRIAIPFWITEYKKDFYVFFRFIDGLKVSEGKE